MTEWLKNDEIRMKMKTNHTNYDTEMKLFNDRLCDDVTLQPMFG